MGSQPLDVYLVEDDQFSLRLMQSTLMRMGHRVRVARQPSDALREIELNPPHVLLTDWNMPEMNGGQLCQTVRQMDLPRYVYTIVVTANKQDFVAEALDAGADDFIAKPVDPNELAARLNAGRRILELQDKLKTLSERDSLTGLLNRTTFFSKFERAFSTARQSNSRLSVVMMDLDHFKSINDVYGHLAGDQVLREVGDILLQTAHDAVLLGRYGGEEFIVGLPGNDEQAADAVTRKIQDRLANCSFDFGNVTASFGVSEIDPSIQYPSQLIHSADQNLLMAKRLGRDRTVVGHSDQDTSATQLV